MNKNQRVMSDNIESYRNVNPSEQPVFFFPSSYHLQASSTDLLLTTLLIQLQNVRLQQRFHRRDPGHRRQKLHRRGVAERNHQRTVRPMPRLNSSLRYGNFGAGYDQNPLRLST